LVYTVGEQLIYRNAREGDGTLIGSRGPTALGA
jgi:hypothetical protein